MNESLRARWVRRDEQPRLSLAELTRLTEPAFAGQHVIGAEVTAGGQANTNWRLDLSEHSQPVLLRLCTRQAEGALDVRPSVLKEAAIHRRLAPALPVPAVFLAATTNPVTGHAYLLREWADGERLEIAAHRLDAPSLIGLASDVGRVLAGIHTVRFPSAGFLDEALRVAPFPPEIESGMLTFVRSLLDERGAERLGPELTEALLGFAERENFYGAP